MKLKFQLPIVFFALMSCGKLSKQEKKNHSPKTEIDNQVSGFEIWEGFSNFNDTFYLSDKVLIGKPEKLKGFKSLHIEGHQFYELNEMGDITATYDLSNNYRIYRYDSKNRLTTIETKQHTPAEIYHSTEYQYADKDAVVQITNTSYKNNEPIDLEVLTDKRMLDAIAVKKSYFENEKRLAYFINAEKHQVVTFENKMLFCCGNSLEGKNKLTYFFNEEDLIDSLVIEGMESKKKLHFNYKYE